MTPTPRFIGAPELAPDFILEQLQGAKIRSVKLLGSRSTVFKLELASPIKAAFKLADAERPHGPAAEVAAYRLSRCLGLELVPPAVSRDLPAQRLRELLPEPAKARWPEVRERLGVADGDVLHGVAISWVDELADVGLDGPTGLDRAREWLGASSEPPADKRGLAAGLSTMLVFDYLIGNFDRWSGDNVAGDADGTHVYLRDHDLAFPARLGERLTERMRGELGLAQRFSRSLYEALRGLTRARLEAEFALDPASKRGPLLTDGQLDSVFERRDTVLAHIEAAIDRHGRSRVLAFE